MPGLIQGNANRFLRQYFCPFEAHSPVLERTAQILTISHSNINRSSTLQIFETLLCVRQSTKLQSAMETGEATST